MKKINLRKADEKDMEFVKSFQLKSIENIYIIEDDLKYVGLVEYIVNQKESDDYSSIYIEYIDVLDEYRRQGYATEVINMLSDDGNNYIYGNSLPNKVSVSFWQSLDADFEGEDNNLDYYIKNEECIPFSI